MKLNRSKSIITSLVSDHDHEGGNRFWLADHCVVAGDHRIDEEMEATHLVK